MAELGFHKKLNSQKKNHNSASHSPEKIKNLISVYNLKLKNNTSSQTSTILPLLQTKAKSKGKVVVPLIKKKDYHPQTNKPINKLQILFEFEKSALVIQKHFRRYSAKIALKKLQLEKKAEKEKEADKKKDGFLFCNFSIGRRRINSGKGSEGENDKGLNESVLSAVSQVSIRLSELDVNELDAEDDNHSFLNEDDII